MAGSASVACKGERFLSGNATGIIRQRHLRGRHRFVFKALSCVRSETVLCERSTAVNRPFFELFSEVRFFILGSFWLNLFFGGIGIPFKYVSLFRWLIAQKVLP